MFILLGRDPTAGFVVEFWCELKKRMRESGTSQSSDEKLREARDCAASMQDWARKKGKNVEAALATYLNIIEPNEDTPDSKDWDEG
jgi:hypothetical protein